MAADGDLVLKDGEVANLNVNRQGVWWECPRCGGEGCLACARMEQPGCRGKNRNKFVVDRWMRI